MYKRSLVLALVLLACTQVFTFIAQAKDVTLEVWFSDFNADTQKYMTSEFLPAFSAAYPNIKVNVSYVSWSVFYDKLATNMAAGTAPDIFQGGSTYRGPAATQKTAMPIDKYTKNWPDKKDFFPGSWAAVAWEGSDYGIPALTAPRSIVYRSDLLGEAGYNPEQVPSDWDDMMKASKKLTKVDGSGLVQRWGFNVPNSSWGFWLPLLWQAGGELCPPNGSKALFNTPEGIAAAEYYLEFYRMQSSYGKQPSGGFGSGAYVMDFANTKVIADTVLKNPNLAGDLHVGLPMKKKQYATSIYTDSLFISSQTKSADEAWSFLSFFAKTENITGYNKTLSYLPPRRSAVSSSYVQAMPHIKESIEKAMPYGIVNPAYSSDSSAALVAAFKDLFGGKATPQQAMMNAAAAWRPL